MTTQQDSARGSDCTAIDEQLAGEPVAQSYSRRPTIEGVRLFPLKRHVEDGGSLMEIARLESGELTLDDQEFSVRQLTFSEVLPGVIKAWHVHRRQSDIWFVPPGQRLLVGLWDVRKGSKTPGVTQRIVMGDGQSHLLYIPKGVAHGAANPYSTTAYMLYLLDQQFDPKDTDELRLPWDAKGEAFWMPQNG